MTEQGPMRDLARFSGLGLQFGATVGLFALLGGWLDARWSTSPWLLIAGVFLGFGLGLYSLIKKLPNSPRRRARDGERSTPPRT